MCGIAGTIGPSLPPPEARDAALALLHHRGPDARGSIEVRLHAGRSAWLGSTRLSIIDPDPRSGQPFAVDPVHVLVFNGELYNHREIAGMLAGGRAALRTSGDTEVMGRLLAERGLDGLRDAEGMWALALLDRRDGSLLLVRDRFGEKPLYLVRDGACVHFASEIKALAALRGRRFRVAADRVRRFLVHGYRGVHLDPGSPSFFMDVEAVPPGGAVRIDPGGRVTALPWWSAADAAGRAGTDDGGVSRRGARDRAEIVAEVQAALVHAVRLRLRADAPVACLLSGGVDSNAIAGIARRALGRDLPTYTFSVDDPRYDETPLATAAAQALGLPNRRVGFRPGNFLPRLRALVHEHDAPVLTLASVCHRLLLDAIAEDGVRVILSGIGGDELFTGYFEHHNGYLAAIRDRPDQYEAAAEAWRRHVRPITRNPLLADPDLFVRNPVERAHLHLGADEFAAMVPGVDPAPWRDRSYHAVPLRNRMLNDLLHEVVPTILHEEDLNAMHVSVENRAPLLDRRLFEVAAGIPTVELVRDSFTKSVMRDALRGLVDDAVLDSRRKVGFNAPFRALIDPADPATRAELLADGPIFELVDRQRITRLLDDPAPPNSRSKFLFSFASCRLFMDTFAA